MAAILRVVTGLSGSTVLDLNQWTSGVGSLLGAGKLDLADANIVEQSQSGEVEWSGRSALADVGPRSITLPFVLVGSSADDLAARVAALMNATRRNWWLEVRRQSATASSWLQCWPTVPRVETRIGADGVPHVAVGVIEARTEPYALGARVDVPSTNISMDPTSGTFALAVDGVAGDGLAPLVLRMQDSTSFAGGVGLHVSTRRRGTPSALTGSALAVQAESGSVSTSNGTNVTGAVLNPATDFSGGQGYRWTFSPGYNPPSIAPGDTLPVMTFSGPSLSTAETTGLWRCYIRVRRAGSAIGDQVTFYPYFAPNSVEVEPVTFTAGGGAETRLLDLGLVQWPSASAPAVEAPFPNASGAAVSGVRIRFAKATAGAGNLDFDYALWLPADEDSGALFTNDALQNPATQWLILDSEQGVPVITSADPAAGAHNVTGAGWATAAATPMFIGGCPRVAPGNNRVFIQGGLSSLVSWPIARALPVAASYWPRYTWLR